MKPNRQINYYNCNGLDTVARLYVVTIADATRANCGARGGRPRGALTGGAARAESPLQLVESTNNGSETGDLTDAGVLTEPGYPTEAGDPT